MLLILQVTTVICSLIFNGLAVNAEAIPPENFPCQGTAYNSDKNTFRGSGYAESTDITIARDKSLIIAKEVLAVSIKSQINSITTLYTLSTGNSSEFKQEFESINNESVNETLEGVIVICHKQEKLKNKKIRYHIACEIGTMPLITKIEEKVSQSKSMKVNFDKEKFEKIFEAEMQKIEKGQ